VSRAVENWLAEMGKRSSKERVAISVISRGALGVALAMFVSGFFVARVPDATRPEFAPLSSLFVVLFAIPSYRALWRWIGSRNALKVLWGLGIFAFALETFAVICGWPYGRFSYGDRIGARLGWVPWTVPFAWTPLVLGAWALQSRFNSGNFKHLKYFKVLQSTLWLTAFDLVLDPGAVHQGFWRYQAGGAYYGVPLSNYGGWLLSGALGTAMLAHILKARETDSSRAMAPLGMMTSVAWILSFWTSVCLFSNQWLPAMAGFVLLFSIVKAARASPRSQRLEDTPI